MRVTIYQPQYFPRLHYFNRILRSDIFVILDDAQYVKKLAHNENGARHRLKSYQSDTVIKLPTGSYFLTVPLQSGQSYQAINETRISYREDWKKQHIQVLQNAYSKTNYFFELSPEIKSLLAYHYQVLSELNIATVLWGIAKLSGYRVPLDTIAIKNLNMFLKTSSVRLKKIVYSSELGIKRPEGRQKGTEWTTAICKTLKATEYMHGGTAQAGYMDLSYYRKHGITPVVQNWHCPEYPQQFMKKVGFLPNLSILDLLFNVEQKEAAKVIGITDER